MTLKEKLEQIWNRPGVLHACHFNVWKWADTEYWWEGKIGPKRQVIHCVKGRKHLIVGPKAKGKGFSFLFKNYGMYSRMRKGY